MKHIIMRFCVYVMLALCSMAVLAQQAERVNFSISPIAIDAGQTAIVNVNMENPTIEVASCIMKIKLPDGFTFAENEAVGNNNCVYASLTDRRKSGFSLHENYNKTTNTLHLTINGMGQVFNGSTGSIVSFVVKAADNATPSNITVNKISWSNADGTLGGERPDIDSPINCKLKQFTITFDTDGGSEIASITQDYTSSVSAPGNPTKTGYTFAGWDKEIPSTMPAENITIKALWTINKYKLTYIVDGEVYKEIEIDYNSEITPEADPEKDGHSFSGWSEIPETMPAYDVTVYGSFTQNALLGDANDDGSVTVTDIVAMANNILGNTPSGFNAKNADTNEDGVITVTDIVYAAQYILNGVWP